MKLLSLQPFTDIAQLLLQVSFTECRCAWTVVGQWQPGNDSSSAHKYLNGSFQHGLDPLLSYKSESRLT